MRMVMATSTVGNGLFTPDHPDEYMPGQCQTVSSRAKRGKYASRACLECQRRKVKCSGNQPGPCQQCRLSVAWCEYRVGPRRRARRVHSAPTRKPYSPARSKGCSINDQYSPSRTNGGMTEARVSESPNLPLDIEARLSTIEMMLAHQVMPLNHTADEASPSSGSDWISSCTGHIGPSKLLPNGTDESSESFRGGTSSRSMIAALDQLVGQDQQSLGHSAPTYRHLIDSNSFQDCCGTDLLVWACRMMARDFAQIKKALVRYFTYLNPHYPCLNETRFFLDFEKFSSSDIISYGSVESVQFIALINLLIALMKILEEYCTESSGIPGWQEFSTATHLLSHTTWLGRGDILTIQCLIIKGLYLLYIEEHNAAYEVSCQTVRLSYQNGLNCQATWIQSSPFEMHMRQRIFWSIYCLDRNVAQVCGMPYLIQDSEFRVELPVAVNDHLIGEGETLPSATPRASAIPYQHGIVKWGQLSAEVWDKMYGLDSSKPISDEFIVTMDARLRLLEQTLPDELRWKPEFELSSPHDDIPPYIVRQACILHLRINHLQLLLRRQLLLDADGHQKVAEICMGIASDSIMVSYNAYFSNSYQELERYSTVTYLTGALIPVTCIILKASSSNEVLERALDLYEKSMTVLRHIAPGLSLARTTLKRLTRIVSAVEKCIKNTQNASSEGQLFNNTEIMNADPSNVDLPAVDNIDQDIFDLLYDDSDFRTAMGEPSFLHWGQ